MSLVQLPGFSDHVAGLHRADRTTAPPLLGDLGPVPVQRRVEAAPRQQLLVRALLDDAPMLEHHDQIGIADGRQPVGDDERSSVDQKAAKRNLDAALGADVDGRGRLVEDEDARVGEEGPGKGDELPLPERQARAAFLQLRLVSVLECRDELVRADSLGGLDDFIAGGIRAPERDVVVDGSREQEALLGNDPELAAKRFLPDVVEIDPVDRDPAFTRLVEAGEQLRDRGFARPGVPDECDGCPRRRPRGRRRAAPPGRPRTRT